MPNSSDPEKPETSMEHTSGGLFIGAVTQITKFRFCATSMLQCQIVHRDFRSFLVVVVLQLHTLVHMHFRRVGYRHLRMWDLHLSMKICRKGKIEFGKYQTWHIFFTLLMMSVWQILYLKKFPAKEILLDRYFTLWQQYVLPYYNGPQCIFRFVSRAGFPMD